MLDFTGRYVYISGGTSGIGLGIAEEFSRRGANCFLFSVDDQAKVDDALAALERAQRSATQTHRAIHLDVTDHLAVEKELTAAAKTFGTPYVLINSAGIGGAVYFEDLSYERFDATVKISLYGARNTCAALLPFMKQKGGYVVNVSSLSGIVGLIGYAAYSSAKFGMIGLSEALRSEYKQHGIHVTSLCPPQVDTPLLSQTDLTKPPEVKAINANSGILQPREVAEALIKGLERREAIIVPSVRGKLIFFLQRFFPGWRERMTDRVIRKVQAKSAK